MASSTLFRCADGCRHFLRLGRFFAVIQFLRTSEKESFKKCFRLCFQENFHSIHSHQHKFHRCDVDVCNCCNVPEWHFSVFDVWRHRGKLQEILVEKFAIHPKLVSVQRYLHDVELVSLWSLLGFYKWLNRIDQVRRSRFPTFRYLQCFIGVIGQVRIWKYFLPQNNWITLFFRNEKLSAISSLAIVGFSIIICSVLGYTKSFNFSWDFLTRFSLFQ